MHSRSDIARILMSTENDVIVEAQTSPAMPRQAERLRLGCLLQPVDRRRSRTMDPACSGPPAPTPTSVRVDVRRAASG